MSRWLKSVNTLLETLDGTAETVADGQAIGNFLENGRDAMSAGLGARRASSVDASTEEEDDDNDDDDYEYEDYDDDMVNEYEDDEEFAEESLPEDDKSGQPGTGEQLEEALKASSDPNQEAVNLSLRRRRPKVDDNAVSDISFSEYTEEELDEEQDAFKDSSTGDKVKARPQGPQPPAASPSSPNGTADAPPNPPNRNASHPEDVEDMAKVSEHMREVDPSSNHTPFSQGTRGATSSRAAGVRSEPSSSNNNDRRSQSPKVDESPRRPRRSVEGEARLLPEASAELLGDAESVTEETMDQEPEAVPVEPISSSNNNNKVDGAADPPKLPARKASFPTSSREENEGAKPTAPVAAPPVATLPTVSGSPADTVKQGVAATAAAKTASNHAAKPPAPPLTNVNPKQTKEYQKLKKLQALQAQFSKTSKELKSTQSQVKILQNQNQTLESKLEAANSEIEAQGDELRRAEERMEKDRLRAQEEREDLLDEQDEELDQLKQTHQKELDGLRNQYEAQIADLNQQLHTEETRRRQEGGDYTQELQDAIERERVALKQLQTVTTERNQLQTDLSKLEVQQTSLQGKLDSAFHSVKTATEREREAEEKLDTALSHHSRQMSQRQSREAELEKTIFELGTALTVARQKQQAPVAENTKDSTTRGEEGESLKDKYVAAAEEVETLKVQLNMETQRREALQEELNDISRERSEEASSAQARQRLHDRKISDLESTIARLQTTVREQKSALGKSVENGEAASDADPATLSRELQSAKREIESLSTQLLRHQNMAESSQSEILALKGRLQAATSRAEQAEQSLQSAQAPKSNGPMSNNRLHEMEGGGAVGGMRRRVKGGVAARGRNRTIRAALQMGPGRTNHQYMEQLATTLDGLDSWMVETGSFLRHEPLARLAFMLYLITLHVWSFALVVFHTTEQPHGDFGSMDNNPRHWRATVAAVQQQQQPSP